jgi:hypothetical protein
MSSNLRRHPCPQGPSQRRGSTAQARGEETAAVYYSAFGFSLLLPASLEKPSTNPNPSYRRLTISTIVLGYRFDAFPPDGFPALKVKVRSAVFAILSGFCAAPNGLAVPRQGRRSRPPEPYRAYWACRAWETASLAAPKVSCLHEVEIII